MFKFKYLFKDYQDGNEDNLDRKLTRLTTGSVYSLDHPNSTRFLKSIAYTLRTEWNDLPSSFRNIGDFEHFKSSIKRYYKVKWEEANVMGEE